MIRPYPGVENIPDSGLSLDMSDVFIDILRNQMRNQAYVENRAKTANRMFSFGLRWARTFPTWNEKSKQKGILRPDRVPIHQKDLRTYGYFYTDQNSDPIPSIEELRPIMNFIESKLGIDMSNYDSMLGNIYEDHSFIHQHRDTTESHSAEKYPVIVINLGSGGGLMYDKLTSGMDIDGKEAYSQFESAMQKTSYGERIGLLPIQNGGIYAFGVDGTNRFTFNHRIVDGIGNTSTRSIKVPEFDDCGNKTGELELTKYRITLTFRRSRDLENDIPESPKRIFIPPEDIQSKVEPFSLF